MKTIWSMVALLLNLFLLSTAFGAAEPTNLIEVLESDDDFSMLLRVIEKAELIDFFAQAENITLFAPDNKAFKSLAPGEFETLIGSRVLAEDFVNQHFIERLLTVRDAYWAGDFEMFNGLQVRVVYVVWCKLFRINNVFIIDPDKFAGNGIIHRLGSILE